MSFRGERFERKEGGSWRKKMTNVLHSVNRHESDSLDHRVYEDHYFAETTPAFCKG